MNVEDFAKELNVPVPRLLEQLASAGVSKSGAADAVSADDKAALLAYLHKQHGSSTGERRKITLTRRSTTEIKQADSTGKARTIQVEVRKKRVFVKREPGAPEEVEQSPAARAEVEAEQARIREEEARKQAELIARQAAEIKEKQERQVKRVQEIEAAAVAAAAASGEPAPGAAAPATARPGEKPAEKKDARKPDNKGWQDRQPGRRGGLRTRGATGGDGWRDKHKPRHRDDGEHGFQAPTEPIVREVHVPETISVADLAHKMSVKAIEVIKTMMGMGTMVTINQVLDQETAMIVVEEMGHKAVAAKLDDPDAFLDAGAEHHDAEKLARAPVVTVMGHVDHGKTSLLDYIRRAKVAAGEAGGITQHIGAYHVETPRGMVTFLDTPGHEAFTAMRARGAKATDIAILVVAADDGVMPQTVEAINHAQAADVPIVVAVNKIDKEGADPQRIRSQLTEYGLVAEDFGGDTMFVDISAKNGINIQALEEAVLLTADAALDLRANPNMEAQGVAIEAHLDRGRGPVATVLIQRGTLRVGDSIVAGDAYGRVRRMVDEHGEDIDEATPSRPVQVIGFTSVPGAGDNLLVVDEDRIARQIADRRSARKRNALAARSRKRISLEDLESALRETSQLNLILKGDNSGTVEALEEALLGIAIDDEVELRVIDRGVGGITETNVNLASASDAIIIGFNVRAEGKATELANREGVEIRYYSVIYQAIDEIEKALKGMLKPIYEERELGRAEIRAIFRSSKVGNIAGCLVQSGIMRRNAKARLLRDSVVIAENLTVSSLKREKDDATEVREGFECGLTVTYADIKEGDIIETYELVEKARV